MEIVIRPERKHEILTQEFHVISDGQTKQTSKDVMQAWLYPFLLFIFFYSDYSSFDPQDLLSRFRIFIVLVIYIYK
jgi:hypothetical protein